MRILVVSDSHGDKKATDLALASEKYDFAVHLGDHQLGRDYMAHYFRHWVAGNNDIEGEDQVVFEADGHRFLMLHGHQCSRFSYKGWMHKLAERGKAVGAEAVLFGHSHFAESHAEHGIVLANPGSLSMPRPWGAASNPPAVDPSRPSYLVIDTGAGIQMTFKNLNER